MNQKAWHEWRKSGIGSSDAAVLMGVSPWKTPRQLWEEKVFGNSEQFENSAMSRGKELEEPARQAFEKELNVIVFPKNVVNADKSWLRASLDGIDVDSKIMVEIKCPNKDDHAEAKKKKIPLKYIPQCQHQLAVTGLDGMYYFSFDGSNGVIVEVARDQQYIDDMLGKEQAFWDMVLNQTPPELMERDCVCMNSNAEWIELSNKWKETNNALKALEMVDQDLRKQLIALSKGKDSTGNNLRLNKAICKGNIDYKLAIQEYLDNMRSHYPEVTFPDIVLEPYRKASFVKWTPRVMD
jgi:putative phage-type endonuclease